LGLNYIALAGEVISSPEKKHTPDGQAVTTFSLSMPSQNEEDNSSAVIKVSAIKKLADKILNLINIGDTVFVEGKLYTKVVENKFSQKQKIPFIQSTNIEVIKSKYNRLSLEDLDIESNPHKSIEKKNIDDEEIPF
jgi:single-strand DNA-binding protein